MGNRIFLLWLLVVVTFAGTNGIDILPRLFGQEVPLIGTFLANCLWAILVVLLILALRNAYKKIVELEKKYEGLERLGMIYTDPE